MTGRDVIRWIQENDAEDLPVMIRRHKGESKEPITPEDLEIKVSVVEENKQLQYKKVFLI